MSFSLCKQLHPPTGVTFCLPAYFIYPSSARRADGTSRLPNLIVVKANVLEIHVVRLRNSPGVESGDGGGAQLELLAEVPLHGLVEDIAVLRAAVPSQRDSLMLAFAEAKVSVVEWDAEMQNLRTSSLHSYERPPFKGGAKAHVRGPRVVVDPQGRAGAALVYGGHLALFRVVETDLNDRILVEDARATVEGGSVGRAAKVASSYVMELSDPKGHDIRYVKDLAFLHGYNEPCICVLHETQPSWSGRLKDVKDTAVITALSLNLQRRKHPVIWRATGLPSDALQLLPVPAPTGGVLVVCPNLLLYYSGGTQPTCRLGVNPMASPGQLIPADPNPDPMAPPPEPKVVPTGVAHNALASLSHGAPLAEGINAQLDGARLEWLEPTVAIASVRSGQLFLVQLIMDGSKVGRLSMTRGGAAVLASGLCALRPPGPATGRGLIFVGSRLGDSLLVQFTRAGLSAALGPEATAAEAAGGGDDDDEDDALYGSGPAPKKARPSAPAPPPPPAPGAPAGGEEDEDELSIYMSSAAAPSDKPALAQGSSAVVRYTLQVKDSMLCVGPVRDMAVGEVLSTEAGGSAGGGGGGSGGAGHQKQEEMVMCVGHGKNGALGVVREGVHPEVITEVPLPVVQAAWAVHHKPPGAEGGAGGAGAAAGGEQQYHSYLLLSLDGSTLVLETGEELEEVSERVQFVTRSGTVAAGNVFGMARIVQVHTTGVRLMAGPVSADDLPLTVIVQQLGMLGAQAAAGEEGAQALATAGATVASASIVDPYVLLRLDTGVAVLLAGDAAAMRLAPVPPPEALHPDTQPAKVVACTLFRDTGDWLGRQVCGGSPEDLHEGGRHLCVVAREGGAVEIYLLPTWEKIFECPDFSDGPRVVYNGSSSGGGIDGDAAGPSRRPAGSEVRGAASVERVEVAEVMVAAFEDQAAGRPYLLALLADGGMLAYTAFAFGPLPPDGGAVEKVRARLRFSRLHIDRWPEAGVVASKEGHGNALRAPMRMVRFEALGAGAAGAGGGAGGNGYSGVFVGGTYPLMLVAVRGVLRPHPMLRDGPLAAFTPFHNVNCPHGFIYSTPSGVLKICQLPARVRYDGHWPVRKVPLRCTAHHVCWHASAGVFIVIVSRAVPFRQRPPDDGTNDAHAALAMAANEARLREAGREIAYEIRVVRPGTWETAWTHRLQPSEWGMCLASVKLRDATLPPGAPPRSLVAVGTSTPIGEDCPCKGRIMVIRVDPAAGAGAGQQAAGAEGGGGAEGGAAAGLQCEVLFKREFHRPVTALAGLEGNVAIAIGTQIQVCRWAPLPQNPHQPQLTAIAFYDAPLHVVSLTVVKNFLLLGDIMKSIHFLRWKVVRGPTGMEECQLSALGKDFEQGDVIGTEFLIDGSNLSLVSADLSRNLRVFSYAPQSLESWKGQKLLPRSNFHVGSMVTKLVRRSMRPALGGSGGTAGGGGRRFALLFGTADGGLGYVAPIDEATFRRLQVLQRRLLLATPHAAGLNPQAFRAAVGGRVQPSTKPPPDNMLDGELLYSGFCMLRRRIQAELARSIGTTRAQIIQNLGDLSSTTAFL